MRGKYMVCGLLLIFVASGAQAETQEKEQQEQTKPSLELLEFLGDWETDDGVWIDPSELNQIILPEKEGKNNEK